MIRVRHCRVTSLASGMLRMILPGLPTSGVLRFLSWLTEAPNPRRFYRGPQQTPSLRLLG
jgi:hypothetical protein